MLVIVSLCLKTTTKNKNSEHEENRRNQFDCIWNLDINQRKRRIQFLTNLKAQRLSVTLNKLI